ncbi:leucyl aminopeptidase [Corynebacterium humireducens NBRC 106098 = DSM 45392]|uniref:Leucyl aminopeptidase n=1 Tax=Corynebacterium humireducens NBRC 106098 = DSM 45392 TaxID=1223515 RepID=A0A0B5D0A4_9CORY|nr:leucyl aminopeptidase [Corynebacterium humireducens NBRC 106098 = DSM 45392]
MTEQSVPGEVPAGVGDLDDELDLHRGTQRQLGDADGGTDVGAGLTEDLPHEVGGTVDHGGLAGEAVGGGDEADDLDDAGHVVDTNEVVDGRQGVERGGPGEAGGLLRGDVLVHLAGGGELTVDEGQLTRGPHLVTGAQGRDVRRDGGGDLRQGDLQALEARGPGGHHFTSRFM